MTLDPLVGRLLGGRFRVDSELGRGAMGVVYAGTQSSLARSVAIKILRRELSTDANMVARFRSEAEQAARLSHPNIVEIIDFGHEPDGVLWIAMERLDGESLGARLERVRTLPERETVRIALEILQALEVAHEHRVVHRDLKPDNVFLSRAQGGVERVKLVDFGIAKLDDGDARARLTATGAVVGTPYYMSPEQARSLHVDGRTDLYALGAMMYEMLAGRPPLVADGYTALLIAILSEEPPPLPSLSPSTSAGLARVIENAMKKDRNARFSSATEMAQALSELNSPATFAGASAFAATLQSGAFAVHASTSAVSAAPVAAAVVHAQTSRSGRSLAWIIGVSVFATLLAVGGAAALYLWRQPVPRTPTVPAQNERVAHAPTPAIAPQPAPAPVESVAAVDPAKPLPVHEPVAPAPLADGPSAGAPEHGRAGRTRQGGRAVANESASPPPSPGGGAAGGRPVDSIRFGGGEMPNIDPDSVGAAMRSVPWERCWPAGASARIQNTARSFSATVSGAGIVTAVRADSDEPEAFMRCAAQRIRTLHFGATTNGEPTEIRLWLRVEPRW